MRSPRTRAMTAQETAPTIATAVQMTIERVREAVFTRGSSLFRPITRAATGHSLLMGGYPSPDGSETPAAAEPSAQNADLVARVGEPGGDRLGVLVPARLEHQLDR